MRKVNSLTAATKWPARPSCGQPSVIKKRLPRPKFFDDSVEGFFKGYNRLKRKKVHSLTGRITPELMREAFKSVKRNRGAAGI
jgi:hypothetical protein